MRRNEHRRHSAAAWLILGALLCACGASRSPPTSDTRATALTTARASDATAAPDDEGASTAGESVDRQARVRQGFAVAPVSIETAGLTGRQRMLVGLGSYLVNAAGDCAGCHGGPPAYLAGGVRFAIDGAGHRVWSRNLTPDPATGLQLTLDQFRDALRTGHDYRPGATAMLLVMPWLYLRWESDLDLEAIYAYLRAIPPVTNAVPSDDKPAGPLSIAFAGAYTDGDVERPLPPEDLSFDWRRGLAISPRAIPPSVRGADARAYGVGSYVANATMGCNECHTHEDRAGARVNTAAFLTGGTVYATPPPLQPVTGYVRAMSANLEGATHGFLSEPGDSYARFHDIMLSGTLVDESPPRKLAFPMFIVAGSLRNLLDGDLQSLYTYLAQTERTSGAFDLPRQPPARACGSAADCRTGEACAAATHECVGGACAADSDCGACQTCGSGTCQAPAATSACVLTAH